MKLLFIFGTHCELIKLAPIIKQCERYGIIAECCSTGQHAEMLRTLLIFLILNRSRFESYASKSKP